MYEESLGEARNALIGSSVPAPCASRVYYNYVGRLDAPRRTSRSDDSGVCLRADELFPIPSILPSIMPRLLILETCIKIKK